MDFDGSRFAALRNQGTIVQPDVLGGAWKAAQGVIPLKGEGQPTSDGSQATAPAAFAWRCVARKIT